MSPRVLAFPVPARAARGGASRWQVMVSRVRTMFARLAGRCGVPGAIAPTVIHDALTGQRLEISVDPWFTRISVDGRDYYFRRFTGRFDGKGIGCS